MYAVLVVAYTKNCIFYRERYCLKSMHFVVSSSGRLHFLQLHIGKESTSPPQQPDYSKSPHIATYFFESQAEIGAYFKGTKTNVWVNVNSQLGQKLSK